ncbi:MAG: hypothetical protein ABSF64_36335 [Bryobacteraceae bacterium]|jgi:hypothetical protein
MATKKQIAANRRNALKSTGPRSTRSKGFTRLNAFRHGLRAAATTPLGTLKELAQIRSQLTQSFQPQTAEQVRLLDQMAHAQWQWFYWLRTETRVLGEASASGLARQVSLFDRFSKRVAHYERILIETHREYERSTRAKRS